MFLNILYLKENRFSFIVGLNIEHMIMKILKFITYFWHTRNIQYEPLD